MPLPGVTRATGSKVHSKTNARRFLAAAEGATQRERGTLADALCIADRQGAFATLEADAGGHANWGPKEIPKGTYLMMGDHRDNSADGRVFGFVPEQFVVGKAFMVYWPPKRFGSLPKADPGGPDSRKADPNCFEGGVPDGQTLDRDG